MVDIPLYKNLEEQFLNSFKMCGSVLIRPLREYRSMEDPIKEDKTESSLGLSFRLTETIKGPSEEFNIPGSNIGIRNGYMQIDPGAIVDFNSGLPDVYAFCVTEEPQEHLGETNYKINDPLNFGYELARALTEAGKPVIKWQLAKVQYGKHKDTITTLNEFDIAKAELEKGEAVGFFSKPTKNPNTGEDYTKDGEWRYIFLLDDDTQVTKIDPVQSLELLKFCDF